MRARPSRRTPKSVFQNECSPLEHIPTDEGGGQGEERLMSEHRPLGYHAQLGELVLPGEGPLHYPACRSQSAAVLRRCVVPARA
jgi:hypothetical protein